MWIEVGILDLVIDFELIEVYNLIFDENKDDLDVIEEKKYFMKYVDELVFKLILF